MDRVQRYNQHLVRTALKEARLVTALEVASGRRLRVTSATWDEYWGECGPVANELAQLKRAWIGQFRFKNGRAFRQFSASDYFKAMHVVMGGRPSAREDTFYVPLRTFDDATLVLPSGRSLIAQLLKMAYHLVIEDADLLPCQLTRHFKQFALDDLSVTDLTP